MAEQPRAVIFDWDNTLVDSWGPIHDALNETLTAMGHAPWSLEETKARVRLSLKDSFPALFGDAWMAARDIYLAAFERIHMARLSPLLDAKACLDALVNDCYLAIVSNKTGRLLRREVEVLGWNGYFSQIIGAGDAAADKPHRAPIDLALTASGIEAGAAVWYVGDTELDMVTARAAGCIAVLIHQLGGQDDVDTDVSPQPDLSFDGFLSMLATFRSWKT